MKHFLLICSIFLSGLLSSATLLQFENSDNASIKTAVEQSNHSCTGGELEQTVISKTLPHNHRKLFTLEVADLEEEEERLYHSKTLLKTSTIFAATFCTIAQLYFSFSFKKALRSSMADVSNSPNRLHLLIQNFRL